MEYWEILKEKQRHHAVMFLLQCFIPLLSLPVSYGGLYTQYRDSLSTFYFFVLCKEKGNRQTGLSTPGFIPLGIRVRAFLGVNWNYFYFTMIIDIHSCAV